MVLVRASWSKRLQKIKSKERHSDSYSIPWADAGLCFIRNKLVINCDELVGHDDHIMMKRFARQIHFYPMFNFLVQASSMIDNLITATTGAKAGKISRFFSDGVKVCSDIDKFHFRVEYDN